jgi:pimeloyl-ACP methyl ester carboxylesterase
MEQFTPINTYRMKQKHLLLLFFLVISIQNFAQKINYGSNPTAGKYYEVNGIKLYAEVYGQGKPLLMLHGNGGNISAFAKNIPYFSKYYKVIAVDTRAHGKSIDTGDALTFEIIADDFAKLMDLMKIDSAYVIGWSDGGIDALVLAMRHPKKVIKLAATGANMWVDSTVFIAGFLENMNKEYREKKDKVFATQKEKNDFKVFALDVLEPNYKQEAMKNVLCPALIIAGDKDLITVEHTLQIFKPMPKGQLWILPKSGHATLVEYASEFNRKVHAFFKEK